MNRFAVRLDSVVIVSRQNQISGRDEFWAYAWNWFL